MRDATNQARLPDGAAGYYVQYLGEDGWATAYLNTPSGCPYVFTKDNANDVFRKLKALAPSYEFRIYPALKL